MVGAGTGSYWVIGEKRMAGAVTHRRRRRHNEGTPSRLRNLRGLSDLGQNVGTDVNVPNGLNLNPNPAIAPAALSNRTMPRFPAVCGS
jgi:hypothetical protein